MYLKAKWRSLVLKVCQPCVGSGLAAGDAAVGLVGGSAVLVSMAVSDDAPVSAAVDPQPLAIKVQSVTGTHSHRALTTAERLAR
jgi:hypothetical protein